MFEERSVAVQGLIEALGRQRGRLEVLLFKLVLANLVLAEGDGRFVAPAIAEVDDAVALVHTGDGSVEAALTDVAAEWGLDAPITVADLLGVVPELLRSQLEDHQAWLTEVITEIETVTRDNRRLAVVGLDAVRGSLGLAEALTYGADGFRQRSDRPDSHMERAL